MRLANERSGSTSLFAQPFAVEAVPLDVPATAEGHAGSTFSTRDVLESRLDEALSQLARSSPKSASSQVLSDHLALFTRWFYRPAARRIGEIVFAEGGAEVARKTLLRAISRVAVRSVSEDRAQMDQAPLIH